MLWPTDLFSYNFSLNLKYAFQRKNASIGSGNAIVIQYSPIYCCILGKAKVKQKLGIL